MGLLPYAMLCRPIPFASINDLNRRRLNDSTNELDAALVVHDNRA
jgi:hypothetical protein